VAVITISSEHTAGDAEDRARIILSNTAAALLNAAIIAGIGPRGAHGSPIRISRGGALLSVEITAVTPVASAPQPRTGSP
jgi:hypothetical protein